MDVVEDCAARMSLEELKQIFGHVQSFGDRAASKLAVGRDAPGRPGGLSRGLSRHFWARVGCLRRL